MFEEILKKLDLSESEAKMYLVLLENGTLSIQDISMLSKINRTTLYNVAESLINKGLIKEKNEGGRGKKIKKYSPLSPEDLLIMVSKLEQKQKNIHSDIEKLVPDLIKLSSDTHRPRITLFDGEEGVKNIFPSLINNEAGDILRRMSHVRAKKTTNGIQVKGIENLKEDTKDDYDLNIYLNRVSISSQNKKFGIMIENQEIASIVKALFDLASQDKTKSPPKAQKSS